MNPCIICTRTTSCGHARLCCLHYDEVNADDYRRVAYQDWLAANQCGSTVGFVHATRSNPAPFPLDHQCEDAVHRGAAESMCSVGCGQCNQCEPQCRECHACYVCADSCSFSGDNYCCTCMDIHHCNACNSTIWESDCEEGDFLCSSCCACHEEEDEEPEACRSTSPVGRSLLEVWDTIKQQYIGDCNKCRNTMIACTCIDY
jgi:hypothetical protein